MKFKATFRAPTLNIAAYIKRVSEELNTALAQAAFEWIGAATAEIPVWSGASHATFLNLAREIGFQLTINPAPNAPRRVGYGLRNGKGEFVSEPSAGVYEFTYETSLKHLVYNEFNNANLNPDPGLLGKLLTPGPYDFQGAARAAFLRSVSNVGLPSDPFQHIKVKIVARVK